MAADPNRIPIPATPCGGPNIYCKGSTNEDTCCCCHITMCMFLWGIHHIVLGISFIGWGVSSPDGYFWLGLPFIIIFLSVTFLVLSFIYQKPLFGLFYVLSMFGAVGVSILIFLLCLLIGVGVIGDCYEYCLNYWIYGFVVLCYGFVWLFGANLSLKYWHYLKGKAHGQ